MTAEVLVIDNKSTDNSIAYLQPRFPSVRFLENSENIGFARACNQGMQSSTGDYVLFLNPDTILPEDCLRNCLGFLDSRPEAGALGIRMTDGSGRFLKESKRSFPSPLTSLFKLFGLSQLFPKSRTFSRYHLGHLDEHENHEVDVLAGAFMMVRREVLVKTGGFDEIFFMYGEDVDLSFRIQKLGYKNYYFADSSIIHFKGESTKKGSMNYVRMFYKAMSLFVRKHYARNKAGTFNLLIHVAIWIRAGLSALSQFIRKVGLPLIDAGLILVSFWALKNIWSGYVKTNTQYQSSLLWVAFPAFTVVYLITAYYAGLYDRWYRRSELLQSTLVATIVLLAGYALLPEQYRFSRGIILFGAMLAFLLISILRWILIETNVLTSGKHRKEHATTLVVGTIAEYEEAIQLMKDAGYGQKVLGRVAVTQEETGTIGYWKKIALLYRSVPFREIIFCAGTISFKEIIETLPSLNPHLQVKIHAKGSTSIVGSDSKDSSGEALSRENGCKLASPYNRRLKRLVDICVSLLGILGFPILLFLVKKPLRFFAHCLEVLVAQKTWVGYSTGGTNLPPLRRSILSSNGMPIGVRQELPAESLQMMDYWYARDYEISSDLKLIARRFRRLGGS